jgi:hypothetical protein
MNEPSSREDQDDWQSRYSRATRRIVQVVWWDSSQSANETIIDVPDAYNPGAIAEVVGFLVGQTKRFWVIADSFEADTAVAPSKRRHRSVRNILKSSVCVMTDLVPAGPHIARSQEQEQVVPDLYREKTDGTSAPSAEDDGKGHLVASLEGVEDGKAPDVGSHGAQPGDP